MKVSSIVRSGFEPKECFWGEGGEGGKGGTKTHSGEADLITSWDV